MIIHLEAILTQLVFEHSLRIRLNAPLNEEDNAKRIAPGPVILSLTETPAQTAAEMEETGHGEDIVKHIEIVDTSRQSETTNDNSSTDQKGKNQETTEALATVTQPISTQRTESEPSLSGTMTNLVTTDLQILKMPAGQMIFLRQPSRSLFPRLTLVDGASSP